MQPVSCHHAQDPFAQGLGPYTEIPAKVSSGLSRLAGDHGEMSRGKVAAGKDRTAKLKIEDLAQKYAAFLFARRLIRRPSREKKEKS